MRITGTCCSGIPGVGIPKGNENIDSNNVKYYSTDSSNVGNNDKVVVIISDVFGYDSVHTRIIADRYADEIGCRVYVCTRCNAEPRFTRAANGSSNRIDDDRKT